MTDKNNPIDPTIAELEFRAEESLRRANLHPEGSALHRAWLRSASGWQNEAIRVRNEGLAPYLRALHPRTDGVDELIEKVIASLNVPGVNLTTPELRRAAVALLAEEIAGAANPLRPYLCTDEASGGLTVTYEARSAEAALAEYIADALSSPSSYNQGEDGVSAQIPAYARFDDPETGDIDEASGVIDFGTDEAEDEDDWVEWMEHDGYETGPGYSYEILRLRNHGYERDGWYWQACHAGCLPDSDYPTGPFVTREDAVEDALGDA